MGAVSGASVTRADQLVCRPRGGTGLAAFIIQLARNWRSRRVLGRLERLDEHLLLDIGLTRADVAGVRGLPLDCDPVAWIHHRVACNRAAGGGDRHPVIEVARRERTRQLSAL